MAELFPDGTVKFSDGSYLLDNEPLTGKHTIELILLIPKLIPALGMVGFPMSFGRGMGPGPASGGGGGGGGGGAGAAAGVSQGQGTPGLPGISGASGFSGQSGFSGFSGVSGTSGFSGVSGYSGKSGFSGIATSGFSGFSGAGVAGFAFSDEKQVVGASQTVSSATFVDVTGTDLTFILAAQTLVRIDGMLSATIDNGALDAACEPIVGINVNGVDYLRGGATVVNVSGTLPIYLMSFHVYVLLAAGTYTATLRMKRGGAKNVVIPSSNANYPSTITVAY